MPASLREAATVRTVTDAEALTTVFGMRYVIVNITAALLSH
jgi:hypothetical protein